MPYQTALEALADPTRRTIFERLRGGPLAVGRIAAGMPVSRPAVSQHLRVLHEAGLVRREDAGTRHLFSVELKGLVELRRYLDSFWTEVLDAFQAEADRDSGPSRKPRKEKRKR